MQRITTTFTMCLFILLSATESSAQPMPNDVGAKHLQNASPYASPLPNGKPTIAITTFENLSAYPENDWIGAGFAESLTTKLAKLENIDIIERRQLAVVLKESGLEQKAISEIHWEKVESVSETLFNLRGVEYLLIGSVQITGKYDNPEAELLVNARTVKVETAEVIKGEATGLNSKMENLFELQTKLAEWFVQALGIQPSSAEKKALSEKETESLASYRLYIIGQQYMDEGKYSEAKAAFWAAAQPSNFPAALLAWAEASKQEIMEREREGKRDEALRSAFTASAREVASQGAVGIYVLGIESEFNGKYDEAIKHYRTFLEYTQNKVVRWKVETGQQDFWGYPAIWEGRVYVSADNAIHCFDAMTGRRLWSSSKFPYYLSQPVVSEETVFISLSSHHKEERYEALIALNAQTGILRWQFEQADHFFSSIPVVTENAENIVYICSNHFPKTDKDNNFLYAIDSRNGQLLWKSEIGWFVIHYSDTKSHPIAVYKDVVYLRRVFFHLAERTQEGVIKSAALLALDAKNGQTLWQFNLPIPMEKEKNRLGFESYDGKLPTISEEVVAIGWFDDTLYVLERKTGKLLWKLGEHYKDDPPPILADGLIYLGSGAYDAETGILHWKSEIGGKKARVFANTNEIVFAMGETSERRLYALDSKSGALRWQYDAQDYVISIIAAEGTVYLLTDERGYTSRMLLHALSEKSGKLLWIFDLSEPGYNSSKLIGVQDNIAYVSDDNTLYALTGGEQERVVPSDLDAQISIGRALRLKGELKEAQATLQKVVDSKSNLPEAWMELAKVFEGLDDTNQIVKSWQKVSQYVSPLDERYQAAIERLKERTGLLWRWDTQEQYTQIYGLLFSIKDRIIYVRGSLNNFFALDAQRENLLWKSVDKTNRSGIEYIMDDDAVYYIGKDYKLYKLDLKNGNPIWESKSLKDQLSSKFSFYSTRFRVSNGIVIIGWDKGLGAFSSEDGTMLWKKSIESYLLLSIRIEQDLIYILQGESWSPTHLTMDALELQTGKSVWRYEYETESVIPPLVIDDTSLFTSDGIIYISTKIRKKVGYYYYDYSNIIHALDNKMGKLLWKYETKNGSRIIQDDGIIYYGPNALNAKTGEQIWAASAVELFEPMQTSSGILYGYSDYSSGFAAISTKSGELLWSFKPSPESRFFSYALFDDILYIGCNEQLYALDAKNGIPIWLYEAGAGVMAILISEGVLYVLTSDGAISAFDLKKAASLLKLP